MEIYTIGIEKQLQYLRRKAKPIDQIDDRIVKIADAMIDSMIQAKGIGLAGPQVGLLERIFTVKIANEKPIVFINPQITSTSFEQSAYEEGCLSIPGEFADVQRPASISIQAWNTRGRPFNMEASGLLSTVIQHELDHLNGVLFLDHITPNKKKKILLKFNVDPNSYPEIE